MLPLPEVLAEVCAAAYAPAPEGFEDSWNFGGTIAVRRRLPEFDVIAFRGSLSITDWLMDTQAVPFWDTRLGFVHPGFLNGVQDVLTAVELLGDLRPLVVTGHSLGGARARLFAALRAYYGKPVELCCVFGAPRPGFVNVRRVLEKSGTPLASYRNRNDPVPLVPFFGGLYEHTDEWIAVDDPPPADDLSPFRDHHIEHYIAGCKKSPPGSPGGSVPAVV